MSSIINFLSAISKHIRRAINFYKPKAPLEKSIEQLAPEERNFWHIHPHPL